MTKRLFSPTLYVDTGEMVAGITKTYDKLIIAGYREWNLKRNRRSQAEEYLIEQINPVYHCVGKPHEAMGEIQIPIIYSKRIARPQFFTGVLMPVTITVKIKVGHTPILVEFK